MKKTPEEMQKNMNAARLFALISEPNRIALLKALKEKEKSVSELVEAVEISQPLVSHHLNALKMHGLVTTKREGKYIYYELAADEVIDLIKDVDKISEKISSEIEYPFIPFIGRGFGRGQGRRKFNL